MNHELPHWSAALVWKILKMIYNVAVALNSFSVQATTLAIAVVNLFFFLDFLLDFLFLLLNFLLLFFFLFFSAATAAAASKE